MAWKFTDDELKQFDAEFATFDLNKNGSIDAAELANVLKNVGEKADPTAVQELISQVDKDGNGVIEYSEFLAVIAAIRTGATNSVNSFARVYEKQRALIKTKGAVGTHAYSQGEITAITNLINKLLKDDAEISYLVPLDTKDSADLCKKVADGVLLAKLINVAVPETIDEAAVNKRDGGKDLSLFKSTENLNLVISSAKSIGCSTVGLSAAQLENGTENTHVVLGLITQIVKAYFFHHINLRNRPELSRLATKDEKLADLMKVTPDQLLVRWVNYHLEKQGNKRRIKNFGAPYVKDSEVYTVLLNSVAPAVCDTSALNDADLNARAKLVIKNAEALGVKEFITAEDITGGNSNLNMLFAASIFNVNSGMEKVSESDSKEISQLIADDYGDSREERAFRLWMNSLDINGLHVDNLYHDCEDSMVLLTLMDFVEHGSVDWTKVEKHPNNKFKKLENGNYAVEVGKEKFKFSLVGIAGVDIVDANRTYILAIVWQLMRFHTIKFLNTLSVAGSHVNEEQIIEWANKQVAGAGKESKMANFKDQTLSNSKFFLDLLFAVDSGLVNWDNVKTGDSKEDNLKNAKYAISVARKIGSTIFLLPEDIVEVKEKMILTFVAAIMGCALTKK